MKAVFDFVEGRIDYDEFEAETYLNADIWTFLQSLVTEDMMQMESDFCRLHPSAWARLDANGFRVKATVMAFGLDTVFGRSVGYHIISTLVTHHYPEVIPQSAETENESSILEKLHMDYLGGREVEFVIETILSQCRTQKEIKTRLKEVFHLVSRKYPRWVQDPEWLAHNGKPMRFVSQNQEGDRFLYVFEDVETGERREVEQFT